MWLDVSRRSVLFAPALLLILLSALEAGCLSQPSPPPGGRRLAIVAVDGATWSVISPLMSRGRLPNLGRLYRSGSAGLLKSIQPMAPAPLWTSVATGRARSAHGIGHTVEKIPGRYAIRPVTADRRRVPALWSIASARGLTVGATGWAMTFPVERIMGFMVADGFHSAAAGERGYIHPQGALGAGAEQGEALLLSEASARVASLDAELGRAFQEDLSTLARGLSLFRVYQPRIALFRFGAVDFASHKFWQYHERRFLDLAASRGAKIDPERAWALAEALPGTYAFLDEWIGLLLRRLPEKTTLLIISDHGFRGVAMTDHLHVDLEHLLSRLGYLSLTPGEDPDWSRSRAFTLGDGGDSSREIYLNVAGRESEGIVRPSEAPRLRDEMALELRALKTDGGTPLFRAVSVTEEPAPGEPDIEVIENHGIDPDGIVSFKRGRLKVASLYRRYSEDFGVHDPAGILLAAGEGIVAGRTGWQADLYDILPTILYFMGLPLASDMPGRPVQEILAQPLPPAYPVVPSYNDVPPAPPSIRRSEPLMLMELERLRSSGHLH